MAAPGNQANTAAGYKPPPPPIQNRPYGGYPMPAGSSTPTTWGTQDMQSDSMISAGNMAQGPMPGATDLGAPPFNPYGGAGSYGFSGGGGGGGGASTVPGITQDDFDNWLGFAQGAKPQAGTWNELDYPEYNALPFYEWDNSPYSTMSQGVTDQIAAGLKSGNADFDVAKEQLGDYTNPYGNVRTTNPGVSASMQRMIDSQGGAGRGAATETDMQSQWADAGFGYTQNLLAGAADQRQTGNYRALAGDRRHFSETLAGEERMMQMNIQIAQQKAKAQYDKDLFAYGKEEADRRFELNLAEYMANATGKQNMQDSNLASSNAFNQGILDPITQMWLEGRNSEGVQGLGPLDKNIFA